MRENLIIRDKGRFHLRVNDQWHRFRSFGEAKEILWGANLDAYRLLADAITIPEPVFIEYQPNGWGQRSWLVNGKPQSVAVVRYLLGEVGCNREEIAAIIHAEKINWEIGELLRCSQSKS